MEDSRHNARVLALQKLFEKTFPGTTPLAQKAEEFDENSLLEADEIGDYSKKLYQKLIDGVFKHYQEIDKIITELAPEWPLDKIAKTDLQILRLAIYEGFIDKITPKKVAIDEAIELAKEFSNEQSRKFINGVLGNLINKDKIDNQEHV